MHIGAVVANVTALIVVLVTLCVIAANSPMYSFHLAAFIFSQYHIIEYLVSPAF